MDFKDRGTGINPKQIDYIFDPFFSTHADKSGMGLAVVRKIVHDHMGNIKVESSSGQGTTFRLTLPRSPMVGHGQLV